MYNNNKNNNFSASDYKCKIIACAYCAVFKVIL